jgi:hydrogenase maturation protein HypF
VRALEDKKFKVYTHKQVPTNDGGLSLGQAIIAAATATRSQSA